MNRIEPGLTELRRSLEQEQAIATQRCIEGKCAITAVNHVLGNPQALAHAWISDEKPAQPDRRILEARYRADLASGTFKPQVLEAIRVEVLPTPAEALAVRGWAMPDDEEAAESNQRSGVAWTISEDEDLLAGFHNGMTPDELAERHGRSKNALAMRLAKEHFVLTGGKGSAWFVRATNKPWR